MWIAQLLEHGLIRGSFAPPAPIRELRDLARYRRALIEERTACESDARFRRRYVRVWPASISFLPLTPVPSVAYRLTLMSVLRKVCARRVEARSCPDTSGRGARMRVGCCASTSSTRRR